MTGITYRGPGPWGSGLGSNLSAFQVDSNFYYLFSLITALEDHPNEGVGISTITVSGDSMLFHMTDGSTRGPFNLPVFSWNWRGQWFPSTGYLINDVITDNGSVYLVIFNHTSGLIFNPNANDGNGHNYYGLLLTEPSNVLPNGGPTGYVLTKATNSDFAVEWSAPKLANLFDVSFPASPGPQIGDALLFDSGGLWSYGPIPVSHGVPAGGTTGQALVKVDGTDYNVTWGTPQSLPVGGTTGQSLTKNSGTNYDVGWSDNVPYSSGSDKEGDVLRYHAGGGYFFGSVLHPYNAQSGATYTLIINDAAGFVDMTHGSASTLTVPPNSTTAFAIGDEIKIRQSGQYGAVTIAPGSGVTLNPSSGLSLISNGPNALVLLKKTATNIWEVSGDLLQDSTQAVLPNSNGLFFDWTVGELETCTPTGATAFSMLTTAPFGKRCTLIITTSGTSSFAVTFDSTFKTQGTLNTGIVSGKTFAMEFISDGVHMVEISRTAAM